MTAVSDDVLTAKKTLREETHHEKWDYVRLATYLEELAGMFERCARSEHREMIARFHDIAGRLPVIWNIESDYGALILEACADDVTDPALRIWLYTEAKFRALWCVQGGTAGGECIARSQHLNRINAKLKNA